MIRVFAICLAVLPGVVQAEIVVRDAMVPLAPPNARVHAGYMTIANEGAATRSLIGATADGYGMTHIHRSDIKDGIASMSAVHQIDIEPGRQIQFEHGGFHVMLMRPQEEKAVGDSVLITLQFADGTEVPVMAKVAKMNHGHGS